MAASCTFDAIPRSIPSEGSVRFFPRVSGFTKPIVTYAWDFGDTGTSSAPSPIHQYPAVVAATTYTVELTVTDSDGNTANVSISDFITQEPVGDVPAIPADGTYHQVSVLIYDDTNSMLVNRNPWAGCNLYLLTPKTVDVIDKIGQATFQLLDVGDSTATEKSLMAEGKYVVIITGKTVTFSGRIRRVIQDAQSGFSTSTRVKLWNVECDSDLVKLQSVNVDSTVLTSSGEVIYDTPGNIARLILTPTSPARDTRGVINCVDAKVAYQLNSSSVAEQGGNQYTHLMSLYAQTNYDIRARPDFLIYNYTAFDGSTIITNSAASWTVDEFIGAYAIFVGRDVPASHNFTTDFAVNNDRLLLTDADDYFAVNDRVTLSTTGTLPAGLTATTYYVVASTATYFSISATLGGAAVTFTSNGTGTHSVILKAETAGVMTYGKITDNDGTTITCSAMVNAAAAPESLGYFIIYRGYLVDFAPDLSQPSVIKNLDVNKDVFDFSDNDDKRKLSTKIVATGKDLQGITISVSVSAVHEYDNEYQFFNDSTSITYPSEGYIYKNTCATGAVPATVCPEFTGTSTTFTRGATTTELILGTARSIPIGAELTFTTTVTLPSPLVAGTTYYCVEQNNTSYCCVSATKNGSKINLTDAGTGTHYIVMDNTWWHVDKLLLSELETISITGTTVPTGNTFGALYWAYKVTPDTITGGGGVFVLSAKADGSTIQDASDAGTAVFVYPISSMINTGYESGVISTICYIWIYGWGYAIPTATAMAIVWGTDYIAVTTSGATTEEISKDGTLITKIAISTGKMLIQEQEFSGRGYLMSPRLYVVDHSRVGSNEVLIGEEKVTITGTGNDTTYGNYINVGNAYDRITGASKKCYPHGTGALVARTNYTEASPETDSAVELYGLYIDYRTVDNNITYGMLDTYVTSLILGLGNFYKKGKTWGPLQLAYIPKIGETYGGLAQTSLQVPPRPADRVSFTEYTGGTVTEYQIVSVTIDHDRAMVTLELGDFEKNVFTSLQQNTNAINMTLT